MKRAQIEMMGLVIIVILITLGLFFSVALKQQPTEKAPLEVYSDEKMASDFLITFLESYDPICHIDMKDLAKDCVRETVFGNGNYNCDVDGSCAYLNHTLDTILNRTLKDWNYVYELRFIYEGETLSSFNIGCTDFMERGAPGLQPLPPPRGVSGSPFFQLDICG